MVQEAEQQPARPQALDDESYWHKWHAKHGAAMEWHVSYESVREFLAPYLAHAASDARPEGARIVDVGCGSSTWGVEMLQDLGGRLDLVDAVAPLVEALRAQHASDDRIACAAADCRRLDDLGFGSGVADVVLDKGTLDALESVGDQRAMLGGVFGLLRRPAGVFVSVSFATPQRVLLLRRVALESGLRLRLRIVEAGSEVRLVALLAESFCEGTPDCEDELTRTRLDRLLYLGPLRSEQFLQFAHPSLGGRAVEVEQEKLEDRSGSNEDATGHVVWPAAHSLSTHLCAHPELVRGRVVVELGAGTGLVGLVAAALGARASVLTDLPSTLPLLRRNVELNQALLGDRVRAEALPWGSEVDASLAGAADVVIGCEIVYQHEEDTFAALVDTMRRLVAPGGICLIAYEFRDGMVADLEFFDRANEHFDVEVISLGQYGFGVSPDQDDQSRLLYVYTPLAGAGGASV